MSFICISSLIFSLDDVTYKEDVRKSVELIKQLIDNKVPVIGVFVKRSELDPKIWEAQEF